VEFNTEYLDLKINGVEYKLTLVDYESAEKALEQIESHNDGEHSAILKLKANVLIHSGLPEKILRKLQMKHVTEIFEGVMQLKKD